MTDFTYDANEQVQLDAQDRSKNAAQALTGYALDVQPRADWPGTDTAPGEIRLDSERAESVASWLRERAGDFGCLPGQVEGVTSRVRFGPDTWQQAVALRAANTQVSAAVGEYSARLIKNLRDAADAIDAARGHYVDADRTSQQAIADTDAGAQQTGSGPVVA